MSLNPSRIDVLKGKHQALLGWEKRASQMVGCVDKEQEYLKAVKQIVQIAEELFLLASTSEEYGRKSGCWS